MVLDFGSMSLTVVSSSKQRLGVWRLRMGDLSNCLIRLRKIHSGIWSSSQNIESDKFPYTQSPIASSIGKMREPYSSSDSVRKAEYTCVTSYLGFVDR